MSSQNPTGRSASLSMADFNARAKRIAESTGAVEKGDTHRSRPSRFKRDAGGGVSATAKGEAQATEKAES